MSDAGRGVSFRVFVALAACLIIGSVRQRSARAQHGATSPAGYAEYTSFQLTRPHDQLDGRIEVLEDARIQPSMREAIREAWGDDPCTEAPLPSTLVPLCIATSRVPLRPALLRLLDREGQVIAERAAERPLAELSAMQLYDSTPRSRRTYFYTVDLSADAGSYSGPYTMLAEPNGEGFGWLIATDTIGAHADTIRLVSTLKSGWRLVSRLESTVTDILMVRCRPDLNTPATSVAFGLTFERFSFERSHWVRRTRTEPGCWENDDSASFPARARFP